MQSSQKSTLKLIPSIYGRIQEIRKVAKPAIDKLLSELNAVLKLIESFQAHLVGMIEESSDADYDLKEFVKEVEGSIRSLQKIIEGVSQPDINTNSILNSVDELLAKLPGLLQKSQNFGIGLITDDWPTTVEELQETLTKKFSMKSHLKEMYPDFSKRFKEIKEFMLGMNEATLKEFASLTSLKQNATLVTLEKLNDFCCKLIVFLDKKEIQFSLKQGALLDKIKNGKIKAYCLMIQSAYKARLAIAGYERGRETYPYSRARLVSREKYLEELNEAADQDGNQKYFKNSLAEINKLIVEKKIIFNGNVLTEKSFQDEIECDGIVKCINGFATLYKSQYKNNLSSFREIENKFEIEIKNNQNRIEKTKKEINRLDIKVKDLRQEITDYESEDPSRQNIANEDALKQDDALTNEIMMVIENISQNMSNFLLLQAPKIDMNVSVTTDYMSIIENKIRDALNEDIFTAYFQEVDEAVALNSNEDYVPIWVESVGASFKALKKVTQQLDVLEEEYLTHQQNKDLSPHENFKKSVEMINVFLRLTRDLTKHASELLTSPYTVECLAELGKMVSAAKAGLSFGMERAQQFNEWYEKNVASMISDFPPLVNGLQSLYEMMLEEFPQDTETQIIVKNGLDQLKEMMLKAGNQFNKDEVSNKDIISFLVGNFNALRALLKNTPQIIASLRNVSENNGLEWVQKLNLVIRDMFLFADKIEIQYFMKEEYFSQMSLGDWSLSRLMNKFNAAVSALGYKFKPDECFPYSETILSERNGLQNERVRKISSLEAEINRRTASALQLKEQRAILEKRKEKFEDRKKEIAAEIKKYTGAFEQIQNQYFSNRDGKFDYDVNVQELYKPLADEITKLDEEEAELHREYEDNVAALDALELQEKRSVQLTTELMRERAESIFSRDFIENRKRDTRMIVDVSNDTANSSQATHPKQQVINCIEIKLEKLKQQRKSKFYFFSQQRRTTLENNIMGLSKFKSYYKRQGYDVNGALREVHGQHAGLHSSLEATEMNFFRQLRTLDKAQVVELARGKKIIDFIDKAPDASHLSTPCRIILDEKIQSRIDELTCESKKIWNIANTKNTKIELLKILRDTLMSGAIGNRLPLDAMPLDAILEPIKTTHPHTFYLLFEGRTGKLLNDLELSASSAEDMSDRVQAEIARLEMGNKKFILFRERRLPERIAALRALKDINLDISLLDKVHLNILLSYEKNLFNDLHRWNTIVFCPTPRDGNILASATQASGDLFAQNDFADSAASNEAKASFESAIESDLEENVHRSMFVMQ
jgi:chromosome segregation ATPase